MSTSAVFVQLLSPRETGVPHCRFEFNPQVLQYFYFMLLYTPRPPKTQSLVGTPHSFSNAFLQHKLLIFPKYKLWLQSALKSLQSNSGNSKIDGKTEKHKQKNNWAEIFCLKLLIIWQSLKYQHCLFMCDNFLHNSYIWQVLCLLSV